MEKSQFNCWCIVELFGHQKIAGNCTEQNIAGTNMLRIEVPETKSNPAFTKFFGSAAIYAINPVTEEVAKIMAERLSAQPINAWDIKEFNHKMKLQLEAGPKQDEEEEDDDLPY